MKTRLLSSLITLIVLLSIFSGCNILKTNEDKNEVDNFLVSHLELKTYSPALITSTFDLVLKNYPEFEPIKEKIEHDLTVYKITYSTRFEGEERLASGLVCVPNTPGSYPVLSYQNGTNTQHSRAPSADPDNQLFILLEFMASTGFIITIPDYLGFGDSNEMFHPYLHKESTIQSIVDMQYAVEELVTNHLEIEINKDLYIAGYSLGGWATLQLQKAIEENYETRFNLKASACGAGPYDLNYITEQILGQTEYPMPYFLGYIFNSYYNLGDITTPIEDIFQAPFDSKILSLYDGTMSGEEINNELSTQIPLLFTENFINNFDTDPNYTSVISALEENSISGWKTTTPTMLLHGTEDTFVPPLGTSRIFQEFIMNGLGPQDIAMVPLQGKDHQSGIIPSGIASITWFMELKDAAESVDL